MNQSGFHGMSLVGFEPCLTKPVTAGPREAQYEEQVEQLKIDLELRRKATGHAPNFFKIKNKTHATPGGHPMPHFFLEKSKLMH